MCVAVRFVFDEKPRQVRFTQARARLPVLTRNWQVRLLPWGRRQQETSSLPLGGWARLQTIQSGRWDAWLPRPVKLPVDAFMETDMTGRGHWFPVTRGQYIQGLVAKQSGEQRVYVVTLDVGPEDVYFERWPRIVSSPAM